MFSFSKIFTFLMLFVFSSNLAHARSADAPDLDFDTKREISWDQWIKITKKELESKKFKRSTLNYLNSIKYNARVIQLDRKQPEFRLTFDKYFKNIVTKDNIKKINEEYKKNNDLLIRIGKKYNVSPKVLAALWGIETAFGKHLGKMDILGSLASLAYEGRRKEFFTRELEYALSILDKGHFDRKLFKGSWAGAFGQTQFMPSTFIKYAVDFDGDKKKNLFKKADALASGANYLSTIGWDNDLIWGEKIKIKINKNFEKLSKNKNFKSAKFWENKGVAIKNFYKTDKLRLILPDSNNNNDCYLVSKNFDVILNWNRSNYFALTVFLFSDEIK